MKTQRKITPSEKWLFALSGFLLVFLIGFGAWWQWVNAVPDVEIPAPKLPSPNAYDFYVRAIGAYVSSPSALDPINDTQVVPRAQWKTHYPIARKEAWLRQNVKTLNLLRQGFQYSCRVPPLPIENPMRSPSHAKFREMARLLTIESHARSERDNWSGAADSALDILRLGHDLARGGTLIDYLVGAAINSFAYREFREITTHLNASEAKAAARRLEKILQSRATYADVMLGEKYFGQASLLGQMRSREWHTISPTGAEGWGRWIERWQTFKTPRREIFNNYTQYMDALIANAKKPYRSKATAPPLPNDFYNQATGPVYANVRWNYARDETATALLLAALALRAYKLEHKTYPQNLQQLVPNYLQKIPADPFGGGEALRYRRAGREYSLYSIGPDGVDNHGRAIEDTSKSEKRERFLVQPGSKGDTVAGVN